MEGGGRHVCNVPASTATVNPVDRPYDAGPWYPCRVEWVVVDRQFDWEVTPESVRTLAELGDCLEVHGIEAVRSYVAPGRRRMICIFRAPDAEAVRRMLRGSGSPPAKVWVATLHTP